VLEEHERDFNQTILYGKETNANEILSVAKRFPMMSEYQVIIVKEAQSLGKEMDKLESYFENPLQTTLLVFCSKYKKPDKRKKSSKLIAKNGILFESKKLYENQIGTFISGVLTNKQDVEVNIGISKDFNVFELNNAIGTKNQLKAYRICNYFIENPKEKPLVVTVSLLFNYFSKVMQYHGLSDKSENNVASKLKVYFCNFIFEIKKAYSLRLMA